MMTNDVIRAIMNGELDDDLDRLSAAIKEQRKETRAREAAVNRLTMLPGTRVRLKGLSPKRLNGKTGTIVENTSRHKTALAVKLDKPDVRDNLGVIHVPAGCAERE